MMTTLRMSVLVLLGAGSALLALWASDRNPPTENLLAEARPPEAEPGGILNVAYDLRRYRLCPRETQRSIYDGRTVRFDLGTQSRPLSGPVGNDAYVQPVRVPEMASPGPARYRVIILDYCNPLHRIWPLKKVIEVPFVIVERR